MIDGQPVLLDLFCGEGGAGEGYARAGFLVLGIDIVPRMRHKYPHAFLAMNWKEAMKTLLAGRPLRFRSKKNEYFYVFLDEIDVIHASPPCQGYSVTRFVHNTSYPKLLVPVREMLVGTGKPYVIENVEGAPLIDPLMLCGTMFGLQATDDDGERLKLLRHRLFESNVNLVKPKGCAHNNDIRTAGVYGGGRGPKAKNESNERGGYVPLTPVRRELMGIPWMTMNGLSEAIPPAYTEWIGGQLIKHLGE